MYGKKVYFFSTYSYGVELKFSIFKTQDEKEIFPFKIIVNNFKPTDKSVINEEIKNIFLIRTDEKFRKKFKHHFDIIKFITDNYIVTIGSYSDTSNPPTSDNIYLVCTEHFVNLLAPTVKVTSVEQLKNTPFESLACVFDKKELAKVLLKQ